MIENKCSIVRDLLPLFAEGMVSDETADFVRDHLAECAACRDALDVIQQSDEPTVSADMVPLKQLRRRISASRRQSVLLAAVLIAAVFVTLFAHLTERQYYAYSPALFDLIEEEDCLFISFNAENASVRMTSGYDPEENCQIYYIEAWTTTLDQLISPNSAQQLYIELEEYPMLIYYTQNNGDDDVPIYSHNFTPIDELNWSVISCPRLTLSMYFAIACTAILLLAPASYLLRKNPAARVLTHLLRVPAAYIIAMLLVKGSNMSSYSLERDLGYTIVVGLLLFVALEIAPALINEHRAVAESADPLM